MSTVSASDGCQKGTGVDWRTPTRDAVRSSLLRSWPSQPSLTTDIADSET